MVAATDCSYAQCSESKQDCGSATSDVVFSKHDKLERQDDLWDGVEKNSLVAYLEQESPEYRNLRLFS